MHGHHTVLAPSSSLHRPLPMASSYNSPHGLSSSFRTGSNPNEGSLFDDSPPSGSRNVGRPLQAQPQGTAAAVTTMMTSSLASKPHAFGGAVLSTDHARNLSPDLVLQLTSALSVQASHAAASRGILPPGGERLNVFQGSNILDQMKHFYTYSLEILTFWQNLRPVRNCKYFK